MKSHLRCHFLLLVCLFGRAVVLVKASNKAISCGNDANCQALVKLMEAVNEINNKLEEPSSCPDVHVKLDKLAATVHELHGKQVKDVEKLNVKLVDISTQLEKHSADLLQHDERLKANDVCPDVNENLEKLVTNVRDMHSKQVKDAEELKVNMNRSLASTAAISAQLETHSADLLRHDERLKAHDVSQNSIYEIVKSGGCKLTKAGHDYAGPISVTKSGRTCQRWDSDQPHKNNYKGSKLYPEGSASAAGNKCRNPQSDYDGVWCYTTDPKMRWEQCDVPYCGNP